MGARRKSDARWSSGFSMKRCNTGAKLAGYPAGTSATDAELREDLWGATKVSYHWRFQGRSTSKTFALPEQINAAVEFRRTLVLAIADDWDADDKRRPVRPGTPSAAPDPEPAANDNVVAFRPLTDDSAARGATDGTITSIGFAEAEPPASTVDPVTGLPRPVRGAFDHLRHEVTPISDFAELVEERMNELKTTNSVRHRPRAGNTLGGYDGELALAAKFFRYLAGDERLAHPDLKPGSPMRFDLSGELNLAEADCVSFVEYRKEINLTTRVTNRTALREWGRAVEAAERSAPYPGAAVDLPPAPTPVVEIAKATTVRSGTRSVKAALADAHADGRIAATPWTPYVDKLIVRPPATHYTQKRLYSPEQVVQLADAMAAHTRSGISVDGVAEPLDGGRFRGLLEGAYAGILRPEESGAIRLSNTHLTGDHPYLEIEEAEVECPMRFTGLDQARVVVSLKARGEGVTRRVPLTREEAASFQRHIDMYVAAPDPTSPDRDRNDPRLFTMHSGAPLDLGRFSKEWMIPVLNKVFAAPGDAHLRSLRFRHLRHSGITRLLLDGHSCETVARRAGNSPLVIMTSYRGVIDQVDPAMRIEDQSSTAGSESLAELAAAATNLSPEQAAELVASTQPELTPTALIALGRALVHSGKARLDQEDL